MDKIADLLTRLRNSQDRLKNEILAEYNITIEAILKILKQKNYIESYEPAEVVNGRRMVKIIVGYDKEPLRFRSVKRISKQGVRTYSGYKKLKPVIGGLGIQIISTPKGVMTSEDAKKQKLGGEILCEIW